MTNFQRNPVCRDPWSPRFEPFYRLFRTLLLLLLGPIVLSGCAASLLSAAGPSYRTLVEATESETVAFEIVDLSASTIGPYMLEEPTVDTSLVLDGVFLSPWLPAMCSG